MATDLRLPAWIGENPSVMMWLLGFAAAAVIVAFFVFLKRRQGEVEASVLRRFVGRKIRMKDPYAFYIARESDGYVHVRGTGYLVLVEDELYFERPLDKKTIVIPASSIVKAEGATRLAGQSPGGTMLKIVFKTQAGEEDAVAWRLNDWERWVSEISAVMGK